MKFSHISGTINHGEIDACLAFRSEFPPPPPAMVLTERDRRTTSANAAGLLRGVIFLTGLAAPFVVALLAT